MMLTWYRGAYKTIDETREKGKSGKSIDLAERLKRVMTLVGGVSLYWLHQDDPGLCGTVASIAVLVFAVLPAVRREPSFCETEM